MKALLVIDYTNDFVHDKGALTCGKPGQAIEGNIVAKIKDYFQNGDCVCVINDIHYEGETDHPESKLFPPHNIEGTWGRKEYGEVGKILGYEGQDLPEDMQDKKIYITDKTRYSAFHNTALKEVLEAQGINDIEL